MEDILLPPLSFLRPHTTKNISNRKEIIETRNSFLGQFLGKNILTLFFSLSFFFPFTLSTSQRNMSPYMFFDGARPSPCNFTSTSICYCPPPLPPPLPLRIWWFRIIISILVFAKRLSWSPKATDVSTKLVDISQ